MCIFGVWTSANVIARGYGRVGYSNDASPSRRTQQYESAQRHRSPADPALFSRARWRSHFRPTRYRDTFAMILTYAHVPVYLGEFNYKLGGMRFDLETLKAQDLLAGDVDTLRELGYQYCLGLSDDETLLSLAKVPMARTLNGSEPHVVVGQHCLAESAVLPYETTDHRGEFRNRYFPAAIMRELKLDDVPYFCSFASGCAGFLSLVAVAAGLLPGPDERTAICFMADCRPARVTFDMQRERILGSDHSSAFLVSSRPLQYQLLGINYYSTTRALVPLFEIVKRTVQMVQELTSSLQLDLQQADVVIHYPNIFPDTWKVTTRYLRLPRLEAVIDDIAERAHCGATDSVISLAKMHRNQTGRLHIVVNYGIGLHLALCVLKEHAVNGQNGARD